MFSWNSIVAACLAASVIGGAYAASRTGPVAATSGRSEPAARVIAHATNGDTEQAESELKRLQS